MKKVILIVATCITVLCIQFGCSSKSRASISATCNAYLGYMSDTLWKYCDIDGFKVDGFKMIPLVKLNDNVLQPDEFDAAAGYFWFSSEVPWLNLGSEYELKVDYGEGDAHAKVTMPGQFTITRPDSTYVLPKGSDLSVTWGSSTGAEWYWVYVDGYYYYVNKSGQTRHFDLELDTIMTGTELVLKADRLFPADVDSIIYGNGMADVEANSGPKIEGGSKGNIEGDAVGFFWCNFSPRSVCFYIGRPWPCPRVDLEGTVRARRLEARRRFVAENSE